MFHSLGPHTRPFVRPINRNVVDVALFQIEKMSTADRVRAFSEHGNSYADVDDERACE